MLFEYSCFISAFFAFVFVFWFHCCRQLTCLLHSTLSASRSSSFLLLSPSFPQQPKYFRTPCGFLQFPWHMYVCMYVHTKYTNVWFYLQTHWHILHINSHMYVCIVYVRVSVYKYRFIRSLFFVSFFYALSTPCLFSLFCSAMNLRDHVVFCVGETPVRFSLWLLWMPSRSLWTVDDVPLWMLFHKSATLFLLLS